jgi:hypothetical protein
MNRRLDRSARWFRTKNWVFAGIGLMSAYVLYHNERFLIEPANPIWQHFESFKWWLLPHGVAGACALLISKWNRRDRIHKCDRSLG